MGRHPRQPSETGYYHVVTRGNQRQTIFRQVDDYESGGSGLALQHSSPRARGKVNHHPSRPTIQRLGIPVPGIPVPHYLTSNEAAQ